MQFTSRNIETLQVSFVWIFWFPTLYQTHIVTTHKWLKPCRCKYVSVATTKRPNHLKTCIIVVHIGFNWYQCQMCNYSAVEECRLKTHFDAFYKWLILHYYIDIYVNMPPYNQIKNKNNCVLWSEIALQSCAEVQDHLWCYLQLKYYSFIGVTRTCGKFFRYIRWSPGTSE